MKQIIYAIYWLVTGRTAPLQLTQQARLQARGRHNWLPARHDLSIPCMATLFFCLLTHSNKVFFGLSEASTITNTQCASFLYQGKRFYCVAIK